MNRFSDFDVRLVPGEMFLEKNNSGKYLF
jgi:hypothetical protein